MLPTTLRMVDHGTLLSTRQLGAIVRAEILEQLNRQATVLVDFGGVGSITHSFADEAFGKLLLAIRPEDMKLRLQFTNVSPNIAAVIRFAVAERMRLLSLNEQAAARDDAPYDVGQMAIT